MGMKVKGIENELSRVKIQLEEASNINLKEASSFLINDLIEKTPVDTGYAKSRWKLNQISQDEVRITNDAEYIEYLNNGSSDQAPEYFIETTALEYGTPKGIIVEKK
jgi:HK97 gp10 family phage protein